MNKSDLVVETHKVLGEELSKATVERVLNAVLETIRNAISKHESVQLVGFGTFGVSERMSRIGVNPRTKEKIRIPGKMVVKFKPGTDLSRAV
ncbi:MAG: HU family DNA-binding protein [Puniceicoccales bacterium]|jgi:DNA-binding protein HU-beta|nr:HU family DNA-binding protein [Puniceicoccales bacterium]